MQGNSPETRAKELDQLEAGKDQLPDGTDLTALANYLAMVIAFMSMLARDGLDTAAPLAVADRVTLSWPKDPCFQP